MRRILIILFSILFPILLSQPDTATAQKKQKNTAPSTEEIFNLINKHRAGMGLKPLKQNALIAKAAQTHSHNMATKHVAFGHDGFDERIGKLEKKIKNTTASAENVAYSKQDAKAVVDMWLHSKDHRENIEGDYNQSGIGAAKATDGQIYYTQIFIKAKGSSN
jgi:uncharacterized protein YkwD